MLLGEGSKTFFRTSKGLQKIRRIGKLTMRGKERWVIFTDKGNFIDNPFQRKNIIRQMKGQNIQLYVQD